MNYSRLFVILYGSGLFSIFAYRYMDQLRYFYLTTEMSRPALVLGKWRPPKLSDSAFQTTGIAFLICLGLAVAGVVPRVALVASCILYFLYFGQIRTLSYIVRKSNLIPQLLGLMALAPGLDRRLMEAGPTWPIFIGKLLVVQIYASAAYSKLRHSGLRWATSSQLQGIFLLQHLKFDIPSGFKLATSKRACSLLSIATLAHQVTFPIVLFVPRADFYYVVAALLFHIGTRIFMRIDYLTYQGPSYVIFLVIPLGHWLISAKL